MWFCERILIGKIHITILMEIAKGVILVFSPEDPRKKRGFWRPWAEWRYS
jgi:hypothetical protein